LAPGGRGFVARASIAVTSRLVTVRSVIFFSARVAAGVSTTV
jgi:hypothetical protein